MAKRNNNIKLRFFAWLIPLIVLNLFFSYSQSSTYSKTLDLDGSSSYIVVHSSNDLKFDSDKFINYYTAKSIINKLDII